MPTNAYRQGYNASSLIFIELFPTIRRVINESTSAIVVLEAVDHLRDCVLHVGDVCGLVVDAIFVKLGLEFRDEAIYLFCPGVKVCEVVGV